MPDGQGLTNTPTLELVVMPQELRRRNLRSTIMGFVGGGLLGFFLIKTLDWPTASSRVGDYPGLFLVLVIIISVSIHELGHLLGGWAVGFKFNSIQIGPLRLEVEHGRMKFSLRREITALGWAGMHVDRVSRLRRRFLVFVAAGPGANLFSLG